MGISRPNPGFRDLWTQQESTALYKRIDHVALHAADLDRSVVFCERRFGFRNYAQQMVPGRVPRPGREQIGLRG